MIIILLLIMTVAFLSGFLFGMVRKPKVKSIKTGTPKWEGITDVEYENFLKYDGSEQF